MFFSEDAVHKSFPFPCHDCTIPPCFDLARVFTDAGSASWPADCSKTSAKISSGTRGTGAVASHGNWLTAGSKDGPWKDEHDWWWLDHNFRRGDLANTAHVGSWDSTETAGRSGTTATITKES